ncbi:MAG: hypothetical protein WCJ30_05055 [Deltaproteobacteria bacterium]
MKRFAAVLVVLGTTAVGCAPADVAGSYSASVTSGDNGCGLSGWTPGSSATGVPFNVTQTGDAVSGTVGGLTGAVFNLAFGSNVFTGTVAGTHVVMVLHGQNAQSQNGCAFTWDARIVGDLSGDALQGTITYTANTNTSPACATLSTCRSVQSFSGSRPPR